MDFVLPHNDDLRPYWMIKAGMMLYDFLGGRKKLKKSQSLDFSTDKIADPLADDYSRGFSYADCWVEDARLVTLNAMDAYERGATILPRTACVGLSPARNKKSWNINLQNMLNGDQFMVNASMVINAGGPWVRSLLDSSNLAEGQAAVPNVRLVKGSHVVFPKLYDGEQTFILQQPDGRIIFTIPYERNFTLVGTTDVPYEGDPSQVTIDDNEIDYLCAAVNRSLKQQVTPDNIVWTYSGVRSLVDDGNKNASKVTRDYKIYTDERYGPPILSIFGGKITTYRALAEDVMERVGTFYPDKELSPWTGCAILPGGDIPNGDFEKFVTKQQEKYNFLPADLIYRYARAYGTRMASFMDDVRTIEDLGFHFGDDVYEAEIFYLLRYEFAHTAEDILWRRSKLGLHISNETYETIENAIPQMIDKLKTDDKENQGYRNAAA